LGQGAQRQQREAPPRHGRPFVLLGCTGRRGTSVTCSCCGFLPAITRWISLLLMQLFTKISIGAGRQVELGVRVGGVGGAAGSLTVDRSRGAKDASRCFQRATRGRGTRAMQSCPTTWRHGRCRNGGRPQAADATAPSESFLKLTHPERVVVLLDALPEAPRRAHRVHHRGIRAPRGVHRPSDRRLLERVGPVVPLRL